MDIEFRDGRPSHEEVRSALGETDLGEIIIQDIGDAGLILRFKNVEETAHADVSEKLKSLGEFDERGFQSIGPVIGEETKRKSIWAISLVFIMILVYVAWAFRGVSYSIESGKMYFAKAVYLISPMSLIRVLSKPMCGLSIRRLRHCLC